MIGGVDRQRETFRPLSVPPTRPPTRHRSLLRRRRARWSWKPSTQRLWLARLLSRRSTRPGSCSLRHSIPDSARPTRRPARTSISSASKAWGAVRRSRSVPTVAIRSRDDRSGLCVPDRGRGADQHRARAAASASRSADAASTAHLGLPDPMPEVQSAPGRTRDSTVANRLFPVQDRQPGLPISTRDRARDRAR